MKHEPCPGPAWRPNRGVALAYRREIVPRPARHHKHRHETRANISLMSVILLSPEPGTALLAALRAGLHGSGVTIHSVDRIEGVMQVAREFPRSAVVLDLRAADEDLIGAAERLRLELPATRILALSAAGRQAPAECDGVLTTPFFLTDVVRWCARALSAPIQESALSDLATGLNHEIGNPLTSLLLQLQMLKDDDRLASVRDEIALIEQSSRRIQEVVRDVTGASEHRPVAAQETRLSSLVEEARSHLASARPDLAGRVAVSCSDEAVHAEAPLVGRALSDVWQYLLLAGEEQDQLHVRARPLDAHTVTIESSARVPRLPPDASARLFTPLWARQALGLGEGLSLSSARAVFRRHHGDMRARGKPDHGLLVEALLPRSPGPETNGRI